MAPPSPHGSHVFQVTCGDHSITKYGPRAANYNITQRFVIAVACVVILISAIGLAVRLTMSLRRTEVANT
jgi:hypothetical protein